MPMSHSTEDGKLVCRFSGSLDTTACIELHEKADKLFEEAAKTPGSRVVFDMEQVEYVASSFLRLCGKAAQKVGRDNFEVVRVQPNVKKVFKIAGLESCINIR
jgi:anti-anti-sigma factor